LFSLKRRCRSVLPDPRLHFNIPKERAASSGCFTVGTRRHALFTFFRLTWLSSYEFFVFGNKRNKQFDPFSGFHYGNLFIIKYIHGHELLELFFFCKEFPRKKKACNGGMGSQRVEGGMCGCDGREKCREEIALPKNGSQ
jgi:hypothetical protein